MYINEVTLHGNLTRDPELKALPSGVNVCNFSIATNRVYNDRDGKRQESVEYHNVVFFGKSADNIQKYVHKGDAIYVRGRLQTRNWETDGVKHYRTEVLGDRFQFGRGNKKHDAPADNQQHPADAPEYPDEDINPEDIPF